MIQRRHLLALSVAVSLLLHGAALVASPRIALMQAPSRALVLKAPFRVQLRELTPSPKAGQRAATTTSPAKELISRPESVADLIARDTERIMPSDSMLTRAGDITRVMERAAAEAVPRDHEIQPEETVSRAVDAQIVAISEDVARKDIEVPRRLLSPTQTRIVGENETPAMTGDAAPRPEEMLNLPPLTDPTVTVDASGAMEPADEASAPPPPPAEEAIPVTAPVELASAVPIVEKAITPSVVTEIEKERTYEFMDDTVSVSLDTYRAPNEKESFFRLRIPSQGRRDRDVTERRHVRHRRVGEHRATQTRPYRGGRKGPHQVVAARGPLQRRGVPRYGDVVSTLVGRGRRRQQKRCRNLPDRTEIVWGNRRI